MGAEAMKEEVKDSIRRALGHKGANTYKISMLRPTMNSTLVVTMLFPP